MPTTTRPHSVPPGGTATVGILVFDGVKLLDVAGPAEAFGEADLLGARYRTLLVSPDGRDVVSSVGIRLAVDAAAGEVGGLGLALIAGGDALPERTIDPALTEAARRLAAGAEAIASICTGSFILAATGLLDGRRATTHWKHTAELARRHPAVTVEPDAIFVHDGGIHSSAGVTSGIDLSLALIEADHGPDLARDVARSLVVFMQRSGGQSQFSAPLQGDPPRASALRTVLAEIAARPEAARSVADLARMANVSVRHLARLFREELDTTPTKYVAGVRFETAKALLDAGYDVTDAAQRSGFGSPEPLRRAFVARIGIPPTAYQRRFHSTGPGASD